MADLPRTPPVRAFEQTPPFGGWISFVFHPKNYRITAVVSLNLLKAVNNLRKFVRNVFVKADLIAYPDCLSLRSGGAGGGLVPSIALRFMQVFNSYGLSSATGHPLRTHGGTSLLPPHRRLFFQGLRICVREHPTLFEKIPTPALIQSSSQPEGH